ncbi:MAG: hypothetical protein Q8Q23_03655 [bacterium]|nr:hypothetical protein [bacterium]
MKKLITAINIISLSAISILAAVGVTMFVDEVLAGFSIQSKGISVDGNTLAAADNALWGYANAVGDQTSCQPHSGDYNDNWIVDITESNRVQTLYNAVYYHCDGSTVDGYAPGVGDQSSCSQHDADYGNNWGISLQEMNYFARLYNAGQYFCGAGLDGYTAVGSDSDSHLLKLQTKSGVSYTDRFRVDINGNVILGNAANGSELRLGKYGTKPSCVSATNEGAVVYDTINDRPYVCGPSDSWVPL